MEHAKIGRACPFLTAICSMILCTIPPNFRLIAKILRELELERRSGQTDGQRDGMTNDNTRQGRWQPRVKINSGFQFQFQFHQFRFQFWNWNWAAIPIPELNWSQPYSGKHQLMPCCIWYNRFSVDYLIAAPMVVAAAVFEQCLSSYLGCQHDSLFNDKSSEIRPHYEDNIVNKV